MLETIYITRHAFRMHLDSTRYWPSPTGIDRDPVLTSHGVNQAAQLAEHITGLQPPVDRIYSSPYYRCVQTINYAADLLDQPIFIDNGIGEWYGETIFLHPLPATVEVLQGFFPRVDGSYTPSLCPSRKGETMVDIHERTKKAVALIIEDAERNDCRAIMLCTHAATNIALGRALTGDPDRVLHTGCASLGKYTRQKAEQPWTCELNGNCDFLTNGEERDWYFDGDIPLDEAWKRSNDDFLDLLVNRRSLPLGKKHSKQASGTHTLGAYFMHHDSVIRSS